MVVRSRDKKMKAQERNWIKRLRRLRKRTGDHREAYHQELYLETVEAFGLGVELRSNSLAFKAFFKLVAEKEPTAKNVTRLNAKLAHSVIAFAAGAKSKKCENYVGNGLALFRIFTM